MDLIEPAADIGGGYFGCSNCSYVVLAYYWVYFIHGTWCNISSWLMNPDSLEIWITPALLRCYLFIHGAWCNLGYKHGAILANGGCNSLQWPWRSTLTSPMCLAWPKSNTYQISASYTTPMAIFVGYVWEKKMKKLTAYRTCFALRAAG